MIGGMTPTSDQSARHLQRLGALVAQRRAQLGLKMEVACKRCGISYQTYWNIENGRRANSSTYAKVDVGFGSLGTFSRTFHDVVGESPTVFRKRGGMAVAPTCFVMAWARPSSFGEARPFQPR